MEQDLQSKQDMRLKLRENFSSQQEQLPEQKSPTLLSPRPKLCDMSTKERPHELTLGRVKDSISPEHEAPATGSKRTTRRHASPKV